MHMLIGQTISTDKLALGRVKTQGHRYGPYGQHAIKCHVYVVCVRPDSYCLGADFRPHHITSYPSAAVQIPVSDPSHKHNQHVLLVVGDHFPDRNYMFSYIAAT